MTAHTPDQNPDEIRAAVQDAVDAAASSCTADAALDPEERLREELRSRGVELDDEAWVAEAAATIRSGHRVVVGAEPERDAG